MDNSIHIFELEDSPFSLLDVFQLIRGVYSDRKTEGIDFWLSKCSFEEYQAEVEKDKKIILVAFDTDSSELLGTASLTIRSDKKGIKYGGMTNCAVKRDCQSKNIGSKLIEALKEKAVEEKCCYLKSTTAVNAVSSVRWHLKNGYKKCGMGSSAKSNYYSYVFKMPLNNENPLYYRIWYKLDYVFSWISTRCLLKQDGNLTWLGKVGKKLKGK